MYTLASASPFLSQQPSDGSNPRATHYRTTKTFDLILATSRTHILKVQICANCRPQSRVRFATKSSHRLFNGLPQRTSPRQLLTPLTSVPEALAVLVLYGRGVRVLIVGDKGKGGAEVYDS
ncbi:hypothetical protein PILCRDRAFT_728799 [Piloderma croceum F 1598]|uniref:Uncharacterized protein n=1 Tax=Piloderma croceum (strain F 1598) TaxID=765440 RepID=A0A0C3EZJ8_PILCF|nr:hypothetical protein PILCRDRAFT_728799 [Piloderma croceum F 1598]